MIYNETLDVIPLSVYKKVCKHINGNNQTNEYKNRTYYFYNDLTKLFDFDANMLKLDKKIFKGIGIYYIGYVTKKEKHKINSVNPLYLSIYKIDGFIEEKEGINT